ncbi:MAG: hypothetical protein V7707_20005 [Motiliproteus sp.]
MSPAVIVTLIIVGVVVMVGAAFIAQSVENARKARQRKISIFNERSHKLSSMLTDIPTDYLTADLHQFLVRLIKQNCTAILALEARHTYANQQLKQIEQLNQQPHSGDLDSLKAPFNDVITGQGIRVRIKDLVNMIVAMNKDGTLDKATAVKYVNQGKTVFQLISVDITLISARTAEQGDKNIKAAAVHYSSCLKKLTAVNSNNQFNKRIAHVKRHLQQAQEKIKALSSQAAQTDSNDDEWDKYDNNNDNDWQIKQDYES